MDVVQFGPIQHVVHVEVALVERPGAAERAVDHAHDLLCVDARRAETVHDFRRFQELPPVVRAARQPAQDVFAAGDGQRPGLGGAVERRQEQQSAGLHHAAAGSQEQRDVGHVLDDLQRQHDVEPAARFGQRLGGALAVVDLQPLLAGMQRRDSDVARRRIDAGHLGAQPGHRLAEQAAAAADVEQAEALQRQRPTEDRAVQCAAARSRM